MRQTARSGPVPKISRAALCVLCALCGALALAGGAASAQNAIHRTADETLRKACLTSAAAHFGSPVVAIAGATAIRGGIAYTMRSRESDETWTCRAIRGSAYPALAAER